MGFRSRSVQSRVAAAIPLLALVSGARCLADDLMMMPGIFGPYPMSREASGTSWQPDSTPMEGLHRMGDPWMTMWHGLANFIYDDQGGPRGDTKAFSNSMLMFMGRRGLPDGDFGIRVMLSADPLMGKNGYPELFQTGETADGVHPLIDRQHPHNLVMEAAATYSMNVGADSAAFLYAGIAGEPALGPPAFMHRFSGVDNPEAPLSHHWLDSTHITYGVVTTGYVWQLRFVRRPPVVQPHSRCLHAGQHRAAREPGAVAAERRRTPQHRIRELQPHAHLGSMADHGRVRPQ